MNTVTDNSVKQINAALLALSKDISLVAKDIEGLKNNTSSSSGSSTVRVSSNLSYSNDETLIGTYLDGSNLYQRSFEIDLSDVTTGNFYYPYNDYPEFINKICDIQGIAKYHGVDEWITLPYQNYSLDGAKTVVDPIEISVTKSQIKLRWIRTPGTPPWSTYDYVIVTLRYTKNE